MKTKEIDCWVREGFTDKLLPQQPIGSYEKVYFYKSSETAALANGLLKAKIVIEIPEKTGTITESQFKKWLTSFDESPPRDDYNRILSELRENLFGEDK